MAQPNNKATYLTGGRLYSDNTVLAANQSQPPSSYATNYNGALESLQNTAAQLSSIDSSTPAAGACYDESMLAQFILDLDYVP
jgi:hypothetical protein